MAAANALREEISCLGTEWKALNYKREETREDLGKSRQNQSEEIWHVAAAPA